MDKDTLIAQLNAAADEGIELLAVNGTELMLVQDIDEMLDILWTRFLIKVDLVNIKRMLDHLEGR